MSFRLAVTFLFLIPYPGDCQDASELSGVALVGGVAKLKCNFKNLTKPDKKQLSVYWQRGKEEVAFHMEEWKPLMTYITYNFKNRTSVQWDTADLQIHNVTLRDKGLYDCIVFNLKAGRSKIHKSSFTLDVFANFSEPEINHQETFMQVTKGDSVDLSCSSANGFPNPQTMFWKLSDENRTWEERTIPEIENRNESFRISIKLLMEVKNDVNVTCVLKAHHTGVSKVLQIVVVEKEEDQPPDFPNFVLITCVVLLISFFVVAIILAYYKGRRKCSSGSSQSNSSVDLGPRNTGAGNTSQAEVRTLMPQAPANAEV